MDLDLNVNEICVQIKQILPKFNLILEYEDKNPYQKRMGIKISGNFLILYYASRLFSNIKGEFLISIIKLINENKIV